MDSKTFLGLTAHEWSGVILGALIVVPLALGGFKEGAFADYNYASTTTVSTDGTATNTAYTVPTLYAMPGLCSSGQIKLEWAFVTGVEYYRVERDKEVIYVGSGRSFIDTGLGEGDSHRYDLYVRYGAGEYGPKTRFATAPGRCAEDQDYQIASTTYYASTTIQYIDLGTNTWISSTTPGTSTTTVGGVTIYNTLATTTITTTGETTTTATYGSLPIIPQTTYLYTGQEMRFVVPDYARTGNVVWRVLEGVTGGSISDSGVYRAPYEPGTYHVGAAISGSTYSAGKATIYVMSRVAPTVTTTTTDGATGGTTAAPYPGTTTTVAPTPTPTKTVSPRQQPKETAENQDVQKVEEAPKPPVVIVEAPSTERTVPVPQTGETVEPKKPKPLSLEVRVEAERIKIVADLITANESAERIAKEKLQKTLDTHIEEILQTEPEADVEARKRELTAAREKALTLIEERRDEVTENPDGVADAVVEEFAKVAGEEKVSVENARVALRELSDEVRARDKVLKDQGADLLYTDSNGDGISDYESERVYGIDPKAPPVTSEYEGRRINAAEKLLLGFDPAKEELVPIVPEEPVGAEVAVAESYKLEEVALTEEKKVTLTGRALPNSFVTIYVYSTPVIVTVQSDEDGEWSYTLDKELPDGSHTVYTATVNNSGKILARSQGYLFTKTAQAATLESVIPELPPEEEAAPSIFASRNMILIIGAIALALLIVLGVIGMRARKDIGGMPPPASA